MCIFGKSPLLMSPAVLAQEAALCITSAPNDLDGEGVAFQARDSLFVISTPPDQNLQFVSKRTRRLV